jgi:hypothetical protein
VSGHENALFEGITPAMQKGNEKNQDQGTKATHTLKQSVHKKDKSTPFEAWKKYYDD